MPMPPRDNAERRAEGWRRFREGEQRMPPSLAVDLRAVLQDRFPSADADTVHAAARFIDDAVRIWTASNRTLVVRRTTTRFRSRKRTPAGDLRHLGRALATGDAERATKAWRELSRDAIGLIHIAGGGWEAFADACYAPDAVLPDWAAIAALLPEARRLAASASLRSTAWRKDTLTAIARQLQRLTGRPMPRQHQADDGSNRTGKFVELLNALEKFYEAFYPVKFGVQTNGRALDEIRAAVRSDAPE